MQATLATNVYAFVKPAHIARRSAQPKTALLSIWWARRLERRRFARALPWLTEEVLRDYGLTREEARQLCGRPFWLA